MSQQILIFDRHEAMRSRTRAHLEKAGFQICAEARDELEAFAKAKVLGPELIIMDLNGGFDLIPKLRKCASSPKILIFTMHDGPEFLHLAELLGVQGWASKADPSSLTAEVRRLLGSTS